jgi:GNAT superfamily N-acetyltransferase
MVAQEEGPIRLPRPDDIPYLADLASRSHNDSRFYVDGRFHREACDQLFRVWVTRSCSDPSFAGAVFVAEVNNQPCGYITCAVKDGRGDIGLIAVDERFRKQGLGQALLPASGVKTHTGFELRSDLAVLPLWFLEMTLTSFSVRLKSECAVCLEM